MAKQFHFEIDALGGVRIPGEQPTLLLDLTDADTHGEVYFLTGADSGWLSYYPGAVPEMKLGVAMQDLLTLTAPEVVVKTDLVVEDDAYVTGNLTAGSLAATFGLSVGTNSFFGADVSVDGDLEALGQVDAGRMVKVNASSYDGAFLYFDDPTRSSLGFIHFLGGNMNFYVEEEVPLGLTETEVLLRVNTSVTGRLHATGRLEGRDLLVRGDAPGTSANRVMYFPTDNLADSHYYLWADAAGAGSDNSRLWLDGGNGGEVVIGPRTGGNRFGQIRLRADNVVIDTPPYGGSTGYPAAYIRSYGTWTPSVESSGTNPTVSYNIRGGRYLRIGQLVWISAHVILSARSGGSGALVISGLPFTVENSNATRAMMTGAISGATWTGELWVAPAQNGTTVTFVTQASGASFGTVGITSVSGTADIWFSGFYWTGDA